MRVKTQAILKVKKRKMMRVENKAAVKTKIKKTTGLLVLSKQQDYRLDFTADQGFNTDLADNPSFSDYFHLLLLDYLFEGMARHTNKYAEGYILEHFFTYVTITVMFVKDSRL